MLALQFKINARQACAASHDYIKPDFAAYCVVMNAERIIESTSMIEKSIKMICIARMRLFACTSPDLLLFDFLFAIFTH